MRCINEVIVEGFISKTPRFAVRPSPRLEFRLASSMPKKDGTERVEWINAVAFGRLAEGVQDKLSTGVRVLVVGRLRVSQWVDADGCRRERTEVEAKTIRVMGARPAGGASTAPGPEEAPREAEEAEGEAEDAEIWNAFGELEDEWFGGEL